MAWYEHLSAWLLGFAFYYPLFMAYLWMVGALYYYYTREPLHIPCLNKLANAA